MVSASTQTHTSRRGRHDTETAGLHHCLTACCCCCCCYTSSSDVSTVAYGTPAAKFALLSRVRRRQSYRERPCKTASLVRRTTSQTTARILSTTRYYGHACFPTYTGPLNIAFSIISTKFVDYFLSRVSVQCIRSVILFYQFCPSVRLSVRLSDQLCL